MPIRLGKTTPAVEIVVTGETDLAVVSDAEQRVLGLAREFAMTWQRTLDLAVELGEALEALKEEKGHGHWLPWVEANFPLGQSMAKNFMDLARNRQEIGDLPSGTTVTAALDWLKDQRRLARGPRPVRVSTDGEAPYRPLLRFCGPDWSTAAIVKAMVLTFFPDARMALDPTYGSGNFWSEGAPLPVKAHDLDPERAPDGVMDCIALEYKDASYDLVVFDPPHLADGGDESVMAGRFGTVESQEDLDNLIIEGTREAWRVCRLGLIVKVTNHVHDQRFQEETALVTEALGPQIWAYDMVYQVRDHAFIDPSWGEQCSAYNNGAIFLVYRKGDQRHIPRRT